MAESKVAATPMDTADSKRACKVERVFVRAPIPDPDMYATVTSGAAQRDCLASLNEGLAREMSFDAITAELVRQAVAYIKSGEPVFLVARNHDHQVRLSLGLISAGVKS